MRSVDLVRRDAERLQQRNGAHPCKQCARCRRRRIVGCGNRRIGRNHRRPGINRRLRRGLLARSKKTRHPRAESSRFGLVRCGVRRLARGHGPGSQRIGGFRCDLVRRRKIKIACERGGLPRHLLSSRGAHDPDPHVFEHLFHRLMHLAYGLGKSLGVGTVAAIAVGSHGAGSRRVGDEDSRRRVHAGQPMVDRTHAAGERVVAARVENDDVEAVACVAHLFDHPVRAHCLDLHITLALDAPWSESNSYAR